VTDPTALPLSEQADLLREKKVSPLELTEGYLRRIAKYNGELNAFVTLTEEDALRSAREYGEEIQRGAYRGPLHGIPIAHKDLYWTKGVRTTACSKVLEEFVPDKDATVVRRYNAAGALVLGKLNTHEFALGTTNRDSSFGPVRNPWDLDRHPGGSSGGSAVAVLMSLCSAATGSDSGGSIRIPAAASGIVGLKPTFGLGSRYGIVSAMWTMDHPGPMTKTVRDAALMLQPIAGYDPKDQTTVRRPPPDYEADLMSDIKGLRIGVPLDYFYDQADPEVENTVRAALDTLADLGASVELVKIPDVEYASAAASIIYLAEAAAYHDDTIRVSPDLFLPATRRSVELGSYVLAKDYLHAQQYRRLLGRQVAAILEGVDVLATPTLPITATPLSQEVVRIRGESQPLRVAMLRNTEPWNLTGLPALSVPCGFSTRGLPIGLQIIGRPFQESVVLRVGHAYEQATDWHQRRPEPPAGLSSDPRAVRYQ